MMRDLPGPHDLAGEPDSFDDELIDCPWCDGWHSADDDLCPAMPIEPTDQPDIHEEDIDWHDWIGQVA